MEIASLVFDIVVSICLVAAMVYAVILHRDIKSLTGQKTEIERSLRNANERIAAAERNFKSVQIAAQEAGGELEAQILKAREFTNELNFLLEAGDSLAGRLVERQDKKNVSNTNAKLILDDGLKAQDKKQSLSKAEQDLAARLSGQSAGM